MWQSNTYIMMKVFLFLFDTSTTIAAVVNLNFQLYVIHMSNVDLWWQVFTNQIYLSTLKSQITTLQPVQHTTPYLWDTNSSYFIRKSACTVFGGHSATKAKHTEEKTH